MSLGSEADWDWGQLDLLSEAEVLEALERFRKVEIRVDLVGRLGVLCATSDTAYGELLRVACTDRSPKVRAEAMSTLVEAGDLTPAAFQTLVRHLAVEKSAAVRTAALDLFGSHLLDREGFEEAVPALVALWQRSRGEARAQADQALLEMTGRSGIELAPGRPTSRSGQRIQRASAVRVWWLLLALAAILLGILTRK